MRATSGAGVSVWLAAILIAVAARAAAQEIAPGQPTPPPANLTKSNAERAFAAAMFLCLGTRLSGQMVGETPEDVRTDIAPASPDDRKWATVGAKLPDDTPIWVSRRVGGLLYILEPSRDRCELHATQLPVEATFQMVVTAIKEKLSDVFSPVELKPGFSPIAYQFEYVEAGVRYVVHMEGAEPGVPGHALRYSLIYGAVLRQPVAEPPAFR